MQGNTTKQPRLKGKGWFVNEHDVIYVQGSVKLPSWDKKKFKRKSWGRKSTTGNITYIKKHHREVLLQILTEEEEVKTIVPPVGFESFASEAIKKGEAKLDDKNRVIKSGRGINAQKSAVSILNSMIIPFFKGFRIDQISKDVVEIWTDFLLGDSIETTRLSRDVKNEWKDIMRDRGRSKYSTSHVEKSKSFLAEILHYAVGEKIIENNPVDFSYEINVIYDKKTPYTPKEAFYLMKSSDGLIGGYLNLGFISGMRPGELLALKWSDFYWEYSCIHLQRSITKGVMTYGTSGTKNHFRLIPVPPFAMDILKKLYNERTSDWVFPNKKGEIYNESRNFAKTHFKPLVRRLELKYKPLDHIRHTFSTEAENLLVDEGMLDKIIGNSKEVRGKHYSTFRVTKERAEAAHAAMLPVNNMFYEMQGQKDEIFSHFNRAVN